MIDLPPCIHRGRETAPGYVECGSDRLIPLPPPDGMIARAVAICVKPCPYANRPNRSTEPPKPAPPDWNACQHRGQQTRTQKCRTCGNREEPVPVFACAIYGECSIHMRDIKKADSAERVGVCAGCEHFDQGE